MNNNELLATLDDMNDLIDLLLKTEDKKEYDELVKIYEEKFYGVLNAE